MCRLLAVKSDRAFDITPHLRALAHIARDGKEYQGHGWGYARWEGADGWQIHKSITPIWEDTLEGFGCTRLLLAHARSAFRDEGVAVENNMPFHDERRVFIFNGELHGVRIRETGRIGAEKIFNFIKRFDRGDLGAALHKAVSIIEKRARYVRAMNIIVSDGEAVHVFSRFNEDPDYFTMHARESESGFVICSATYPQQDGWRPLDNQTIRTFT